MMIRMRDTRRRTMDNWQEAPEVDVMFERYMGLVLVVGLVFCQGCFEGDEGGERHGRRHGGWGGAQMEERLKNLPPECREKMKALRAEMKEKEAALAKESLSDEERTARRRAIRTDVRARRQAILAECKGKGTTGSPSGNPSPADQPSADSAVEE
jgi:hypothetical protein